MRQRRPLLVGETVSRLFVSPSYHKTSCLWTLAQDIFELLNGDVAALGLGRCTWAHCGFGKCCLLWSRQDTHLPCLSLGFCLTTMRLLRRFRRAGSSGGEWPLPPGGTAPSGCWATTQRGYHCCRSGCQDMLRRHVVAPGVLSLCMHFSTSFLVNTSGRVQGCCCGGVLRGQRWDIVAAGPSGLHKHAIHDYVCLVCGKWFRSSRWDGGCGAALGCCCAARTSVLQVTCWGARKTHATNSLSQVCLAMHCYEGCVFSPLHDCLVLYFARHVSVLRSMMCYCYLRVCFDCRESIVFLFVFWLFCVLFFP